MATEQEIQNQAALNRELSKSTQLAEELRNDFLGIGKEIESVIKIKIQDLDEEARKVGQTISNDIAKGFRNLRIDATDLVDLEKKQLSGLLKVKDVNKVIESVKSNQESIERGIREAVAEGLIDEEKGLEYKKAAVERTKTQLELAKKLSEEAERQEKTLGITYKIFDGITKIPILNSLVKIEKIKEAMEGSAANTNSAFKVFGVGVKQTFAQIGKSLKDPLIILGAQIALIKKFFDLYGGVNKRIVEQGKQLNISKEQSQALYESAYQYAAEQRNAFVTEARILEGRYKLNEALGTSIAFTNKEAITAEKLTHYYGLNEEQSAHLAMYAREIGQTNDDILNTVIKTTVNQKAQFGGTISQQKAMQKISSVSGEILTKFKGNVGELTKAVLQADRLGLTLEQVDKIGESLLNFEQSIEAELKAELLTGKAINLERARSAALSGDTVKLTNEIAKQVGNIHQFEKMNVIQRQAYAEAFGMNASEMGDMLRKREFEAKLGADATKSATEQLRLAKERGITIEESVKKDLEAKSLAELQKYTFEKIKSILEKIASGPMATIYKYIEKGLKGVEGIFGAFSKMTGGGLGNALGAAILGAPLLLATTRLMAGGLKGLLFQRGTDMNPMVVRLQGAIGAMGSRTGFTPGVGFTGGTLPGGLRQNAAGRYIDANGRFVSNAAVAAAQQKQGAMGMRGMGVGIGLGIGGMALSGIASSMEPGAGASAIGVLGQTASYAGMGAMFGPWGAAIGGLVGLGMGLFSLSKENEERRKQEAEAAKETQRKTQELIEQMAVRPIELNVNNDTIGKWNTYSTQNGANSSFS